ncbi:MAG: hypothetical protein KJ621_17165 [Proteobacteria bacterium]|nr:hypothetical protein [Pseudomonadota bacterium]MBU1741670.1 hypothetical protein [Pseudomonadota bacterium]
MANVWRGGGVVLAVVCLLVGPGLAATRPATGPGPKPVSWAGVWRTTFGVLTLTQEGTRVTGTYGYRKGRLKGVAQGRSLRGRWYEGAADRDEYRGDFEFKMMPDGNYFMGRWGKGFNNPMRGRWVGRRMK